MIILGVESTAHTFGVGIVTSDGAIVANVTDSFTSTEGGMIPHEIADHHKNVAEKVLAKAFTDAGKSWSDINFIAYSAGPGLDPALWAGYNIVKEWSEKYGKKIVGVNHCAAHLSIGAVWNKMTDPVYLYVSGVNTQIIVQEGGKYKVIGETLDLGLGNMLDKFARLLQLGFPGGPKIEILAKNGKYVELPYVVKGMDVSFSGILTKIQQLYERKQASKEDLCFSVQETCFAMLTEVVERAMAHTEKKELLLVGGVGANKRFCEMLNIMCTERGTQFYNVPMNLAGDQGAMIAWEGFLRKDTYSDMEVNPHWRVDEV
ncbi:MAG: KEOPS complex N(6)-L-threonylcarbamoyladenine synthase Kae1 [Nanoarchaeota archaeon]|nr:KEOPS complex N(6)-L-threonylcarbamoyladenine synthase Kae1 [Nanoarchaeota archaeon]